MVQWPGGAGTPVRAIPHFFATATPPVRVCSTCGAIRRTEHQEDLYIKMQSAKKRVRDHILHMEPRHQGQEIIIVYQLVLPALDI